MRSSCAKVLFSSSPYINYINKKIFRIAKLSTSSKNKTLPGKRGAILLHSSKFLKFKLCLP
ncbi:hypothetical protein A3B18_02890 [Candidatus Giovannonibacteria bacterium RIFCSPLOWO2_01_FULL_46_13]|uniref:Uncharacterized protein n=1 Tax=Candidatus Giovannonibacteria bacterium RIFCSPLOWO2_01_FULL_46_13 TaxID=1798352 RepID=A0A1F5X2X0_9BACT|nr:MAG: hypothetical protein A3B18_02890 [Candidatus Giovannonibacteria bacterium RIFCSPLOWO2_01_FULL_46_13]